MADRTSKQIKGSTCSPGRWSCSPVVDVEVKAGILMKKESLLFLYVHFDLEAMRNVCNHGLPSDFHLLALRSFT